MANIGGENDDHGQVHDSATGNSPAIGAGSHAAADSAPARHQAEHGIQAHGQHEAACERGQHDHDSDQGDDRGAIV